MIGRCGDIVGVWIEPVTAQVMMTLLGVAMDVPVVSGPRSNFVPAPPMLPVPSTAGKAALLAFDGLIVQAELAR